MLDLGLPEISGKDVLAAVKDGDTQRDIPVVVLTASIDPADRADVEHFDVASHLTRPVDLENSCGSSKYWLSEVILPHLGEVSALPPEGTLSSGGSLGLFK
ncbi:MAG: response regulator [Planctomycetota bacterium]|nr:MAG: response regulator [Planctomycetota bacterium]GDY09627.1 hypothetical protein LBMAG52_31130 [Planctomycetia bacterium]